MISNPSNLTEQILNLCERIATELKAIYNRLTTAVFKVNGVAPTNGNVEITSVNTAVNATNAVNAEKDKSGNVITSTYLTKTDASSTYLTKTGKAASATVADSANAVTWGNVSNKPTSFTPSSHNQAANTITAMTGYSKASSAAAIATSDSLNTAIGKIEKALDGKLSTTGTAAKATSDASGNNIVNTYETKANAITGLSVSGKTITYTKGNGSTGTISTQDTTYSTATSSKNGLMASTDKAKLDGLATVATSGSYNDLSNKPSIPSAYTLPTAAKNVLGGVKTSSDVTDTDGYIACPIIGGIPYYRSATPGAASLGDLGINVTATAINTGISHLSGVTSNIQTQLDGKLSTNGKATSAVTADSATKATQDSSGNNIVNTYLTKSAAESTYAKLAGATFTGEVKATAFQATSDKRLKTVTDKVGDVDLSGIEAYSYYFNDDKNQRVRYGVMAQDIKEVLPHAVVLGNDGYYSVDYNGLIAVLINKINKLENQLNNLKI